MLPRMPGMYNYNPPLPGQMASQASQRQPPIPGTTIPNLIDQGSMMMTPGGARPGAGMTGQPKPVPPPKNSFKLRRLIAPKPPVTVLMELIGGKSTATWKFIDNPEDVEVDYDMEDAGQLFTAQVTVDGEEYSGTASSKTDAKNAAAENAVKELVNKKCNEGVVMSNEDPTPWAALASLALHKLYADWQSQGYILPPDLVGIPGVPSNQVGRAPKAAGGGSKMDDTAKHPVQLLNEKNGKPVEYELKAKVGEGPTAVFIMVATIDEVVYTGEARNKKDAKKNCALKILKEKHEITYPGETYS